MNSLNLAHTHTALLRGPEPRLLTTICWPQVEPDGFEPAAFSPAWNCELLSNPYRVGRSLNLFVEHDLGYVLAVRGLDITSCRSGAQLVHAFHAEQGHTSTS